MSDTTPTFELTIEDCRTEMNGSPSDYDVKRFYQRCVTSGLDPRAGQIYSMQSNGRWTFNAKIDGFRLVAQRTGQYKGQDGPYYLQHDGTWCDHWTEVDVPPLAAKVGVLRKGFKNYLYSVAHWDEFAVEDNRYWSDMPTVMLSKCAEAQALRRAFPAELSGLYTADEMGQGQDNKGSSGKRPSNQSGGLSEPMATKSQKKEIEAKMKEAEHALPSESVAIFDKLSTMGVFDVHGVVHKRTTRSQYAEAMKLFGGLAMPAKVDKPVRKLMVNLWAHVRSSESDQKRLKEIKEELKKCDVFASNGQVKQSPTEDQYQAMMQVLADLGYDEPFEPAETPQENVAQIKDQLDSKPDGVDIDAPPAEADPLEKAKAELDRVTGGKK